MAHKILIVDDEPDLEILVRQKFRQHVRQGRYELSFARDGQEALERIEQDEDIKLVLSDINMPVMDGLTLLTRLGEGERLLRAVIVSAYGDMDNIRTAMNRGAFDFVTKPIDFEDLEVTIDKTIKTVEALRQAAREREELISIQQELSVAARIQMSILPRDFPVCDDIELFAEIIPAREVGGDLYDFFPLDEDHMGLVIGDVSGKGVPAAIYMAVTRTLLRATALQNLPPGKCLEYVNSVLESQGDSMMFVTVFYGILNTSTGELEYACAGHNPPYVFGSSGVRALESTGGTMIGPFQGMEFRSRRVQLQAGESLLLYTDGVTEACAGGDKLFGEERLEAWLAGAGELSPNQAVGKLISEIQAFAGGAPQSDDLTILVARYHG